MTFADTSAWFAFTVSDGEPYSEHQDVSHVR